MTSTERNQEDFSALLEEYEQRDPGSQTNDLPSVGDTVQGRVVSITNDAVFVALGAKAEAMLSRDQVTDEDGKLRIEVDDAIEARVVEIRDGQVILKTAVGRGPDAAAELKQAHEHSIPVEGQVVNVVKGGVEVEVAGTRAFCPISQLDLRFVEDATEFLGRKLTFRIIRYETGRGKHVNIVLSRRALLEEEAAELAKETRARLHVGAVLKGRVTSIKGYGAFVDLGGIEGMLHISELDFGRVEHPSDVVSIDQEVEVQVIKIEKTKNPKRPEKIGLSLKALAQDPWDRAASEFHEGQRVEGKVMRIQPFGAFVELLPGVEGLLHVSQMGGGRRVDHPRDVVREGQEVEVVVLGVDRARRRVSLSMNAVGRQDEDREVAEYQRKKSRRGRGNQRNGQRDSGPRDSGRSSGQSFGTLGDLLKYKKR